MNHKQESKRVISLYPADKPRLTEVLQAKLSRYARLPAIGERERVSLPPKPAAPAGREKRANRELLRT